jgi:UTP--glucose-1-phosphate uridylyltransferase
MTPAVTMGFEKIRGVLCLIPQNLYRWPGFVNFPMLPGIMTWGILESMKAVILAAGYGTRFLPVTKTVPKELLPLVDTPAIELILQEFMSAGVTDILLISSRRKRALEDYFDREIELETVFQAEGNQDKLKKIRPPSVRVSVVRQERMLGTGHALLLAEEFAAGDPVLVAYPDDVVLGPSLSQQIMDAYAETGCSVLSGIHNPPNLERYGVLAFGPDQKRVTGIVEKPHPGQEPSREASIGRYLYTPEFFTYLREEWEIYLRSHRMTGEDCTDPQKAAQLGEYYHIPALSRLMTEGKVVYVRASGERLDLGAPAGYLRAVLRYAAKSPELAAVITEEAQRIRNRP